MKSVGIQYTESHKTECRSSPDLLYNILLTNKNRSWQYRCMVWNVRYVYWNSIVGHLSIATIWESNGTTNVKKKADDEQCFPLQIAGRKLTSTNTRNYRRYLLVTRILFTQLWKNSPFLISFMLLTSHDCDQDIFRWWVGLTRASVGCGRRLFFSTFDKPRTVQFTIISLYWQMENITLYTVYTRVLKFFYFCMMNLFCEIRVYYHNLNKNDGGWIKTVKTKTRRAQNLIILLNISRVVGEFAYCTWACVLVIFYKIYTTFISFLAWALLYIFVFTLGTVVCADN